MSAPTYYLNQLLYMRWLPDPDAAGQERQEVYIIVDAASGRMEFHHYEYRTIPTKKLPYICPHCRRLFSTLEEVTDHITVSHPEGPEPEEPPEKEPYTGTHARMLPIPILFYALLRLRKKVIKDYIHEKLHPWI